jgi:hypothetical protein
MAEERTVIEQIATDARTLMILVKPGSKDPTEAEVAAYKQTLKWTQPFHAVLWNGEGFVKVGADLKEIELKG